MGRTSDARERIVRAAARLFLARSYVSVGVGEVCAAAEVRKGSFYHFFPSKADLAIAVIDLHAAGLHDRLDRGAHADPAEALFAIPDTIGEIQLGFESRFGQVVGCPFGNLATELATCEDAVRAHLSTLFASWTGKLTATCRRAAEAGLLRADTDPDRLAHLLLACAQGTIMLAKVDRSPAAGIPEALRGLINAHLTEEVAA
ncbi:TetR/AcrR family transcriptional regulator [Amycolatopsis cihanbeyliensis]|uniref:TetR family transcriptional regulator n=1 Tax=Amycolatopsis cihanbeyliensis TaxID=1128664 RepID=A0A542DFY9_AMYCI|nr:TetR/AcrR family transcriptional regulator [Amycolatopsis cihanbeyliensis]TQJ01951.1 TetR family transcriptional regulator [Amycolatopsis cihanbeyliensis]